MDECVAQIGFIFKFENLLRCANITFCPISQISKT
ncbi:hypothetical protein X798_01054, partial [Onchocerca flexuosa]